MQTVASHAAADGVRPQVGRYVDASIRVMNDEGDFAALSGAPVAFRNGRIRLADAALSARHEGIPHGVGESVGWKYNGSSVMGCEPHAAAVPGFWTGPSYTDWTGMNMWWIAYEAETGNVASNTRIEIASLECWYLTKGGVWTLLQSGAKPVWGGVYAEDAIAVQAGNQFRIEVGASSYYAIPGGGCSVHGGLAQIATPFAAGSDDINALYASVKHRAIPISGSGDVDSSRYIVQCGIDYTPFVGATVAADSGGLGYWPGAGLGQFKLSTSEWRYSHVFLRKPAVSLAAVVAITPPSYVY